MRKSILALTMLAAVPAYADDTFLVLPFASYHYDRSLHANEFNPGIGIGRAFKETHGALVLSGGVYRNSSKDPVLFGIAGYMVPATARLSVGLGSSAVASVHKVAVQTQVLINYRVAGPVSLNVMASKSHMGFFATYSIK